MKREIWIDAVKGFGILLVLLGHTKGCPKLLYHIIYAFHIPLFFIISGYLYNNGQYRKKSFKEIISRRFKSYIVPYFVLSGILLFVNGIIVGYLKYGFTEDFASLNLRFIFGILYSVPKYDWLVHATPLWFLTCYFCASIIFAAICRLSSKAMRVLLFCACGFSGAVLSLLNAPPLPWNAGVALTAVVFMYFGNMLRIQGVFDRPVFNRFIILLLPIGLLAGYFNFALPRLESLDYSSNILNNPVLAYASGLLITVAAAFFIKRYFSGSKFLAFFGKYSLIFFGFNYAANAVIVKAFNFLGISTTVYFWALQFILAAACLGVFVYCYERLKRYIYADI